jgi:hypothetical protein
MSIYKVTIMWNQSIMGVSETYYTPDQISSSAAANVQNMLGLRAQAMFDDQPWVGVRASIEGNTRNSSVMLPSAGVFADSGLWITIPSAGKQLSAGVPSNNLQLRAVLQEQVQFATSRRTIKYLSGVPTFYSSTEPSTVYPSGGGVWLSALLAWQAYLIQNGWQIKAQPIGTAAATASVVGLYTQVAPGTDLGVRVRSVTMPAWTVGARIYLSHFRAAYGTRASTLNGTWYIDSIDAATYAPDQVLYLRGSAGISPATQNFTDKTYVRLVTYTYYPIQTIVNYRIGIHKRGRPSMAPRGRRTRIPSLST